MFRFFNRVSELPTFHAKLFVRQGNPALRGITMALIRLCVGLTSVSKRLGVYTREWERRFSIFGNGLLLTHCLSKCVRAAFESNECKPR